VRVHATLTAPRTQIAFALDRTADRPSARR